MADYEDMQSKVADAIANAFSGGHFVTKWVAVVEVLQEDGERALWTLANDSCESWDISGLLHHAVGMEQAQLSLAAMSAMLRSVDDEDED